MDWLTWYNGLVKPSWTPAPATIGLIWQILYPIILVTFGFVFVQMFRGKIGWKTALPFAINLVANLIFTPIRDAESVAGCCGHLDRLGNHHLDDGGDLATLPMDRLRTDSVLRMGVAGDRAATVDHSVELG